MRVFIALHRTAGDANVFIYKTPVGEKLKSSERDRERKNYMKWV